MSGWQPQEYDPRRQQPGPRQPAQDQREHWQRPYQHPGAQQPSYELRTQPQYQRPEPRQQHRQPREMNPYAGWIAFAIAMVVIVAGVAWYVMDGRPSDAAPTASGTAAASTAAAVQPETAAAVRGDATQFYALYSAGQWSQAWAMLTPASQKAVPESTFVAVHQGCPSASAGMARVIKSVTVAGSTAVVTETVAGALNSLGSVTDAWAYSGGRWGIALSASSLKDYSHGGASADVAAMKAAGDCAS